MTARARLLWPLPWVCLGLSTTFLAIAMPLNARRPSGVPSMLPGDVAFASAFIGFAVVGAVVAWRAPRNPIGWIFCASGLLAASGEIATAYGVAALFGGLRGWPAGAPAIWLGSWLVIPGLLAFIFVVLLFPDGHVLAPRWRLVGWGAALLGVLACASAALAPGRLSDGLGSAVMPIDNPFAVRFVGAAAGPFNEIGFPLFALLLVAAAASMILRFRRSSGEVRQQLRWFAFGAAFLAFMGVASAALDGLPALASIRWLDGELGAIGIIALATGTGVGVLKYRLYDIDVVISQAVVYGALAAFITLVYVGLVVGLGALMGTGPRPNPALSIAATGVVAVAFQPLRERLSRFANRLVYGQRATPYEVLSAFSGRVADSYAAAEVLPRMAGVLRDATAAEHATVWLRHGDVLMPMASAPDAVVGYEPLALAGSRLPVFPHAPVAAAVRHSDELLGALTVAKRSSDRLTPVERKLLDDLADQAGLLFKNVRLTADLEANLEELNRSRQRLVAAQDLERRRLERSLHDGAQQHLVAMKVKLGLAERMAERDPGRAGELVDQLVTEADVALEVLRDLGRGIYPPLLAEAGLEVALKAHAGRAGIPVTVAADGIRRYQQQTEAAVYFCCVEALDNARRHGSASRAGVTLAEHDGSLDFTVEDDGTGFDPLATEGGSGIGNMADRLAALDGTIRVDSGAGRGTRVEGRVPAAAIVPR